MNKVLRKYGYRDVVIVLAAMSAVLFLLEAASAQTIDFIGSAKNTLSTYMETPVAFDETLRHYETEGGSIDLDVYTSDNIEKIVFSSIKIESTGVTEESVFIFPKEGYEFPVFWANVTRFSFVNILIFDFLPLQDLVMNPEYGQTYMEPLKATKEAVMDDILKRTVRDKAVEFSSLAMYAYSPYKMIARVSKRGALKIADIVDAYGKTYMDLSKQAPKLEEGQARTYATQRLAAMRKLMLENDPGYKYMLEVFGQATTDKIMDVIF
jgi:hypothetical protein